MHPESAREVFKIANDEKRWFSFAIVGISLTAGLMDYARNYEINENLMKFSTKIEEKNEASDTFNFLEGFCEIFCLLNLFFSNLPFF